MSYDYDYQMFNIITIIFQFRGTHIHNTNEYELSYYMVLNEGGSYL